MTEICEKIQFIPNIDDIEKLETIRQRENLKDYKDVIRLAMIHYMLFNKDPVSATFDWEKELDVLLEVKGLKGKDKVKKTFYFKPETILILDGLSEEFSESEEDTIELALIYTYINLNKDKDLLLHKKVGELKRRKKIDKAIKEKIEEIKKNGISPIEILLCEDPDSGKIDVK